MFIVHKIRFNGIVSWLCSCDVSDYNILIIYYNECFRPLCKIQEKRTDNIQIANIVDFYYLIKQY